MSGKAFFDTNIFIYAYDPRDLRKKTIAIKLIESVASQGRAVISYQIIQEFLNFSLRKAEVKMLPDDAQQMLTTVFRPLQIVSPSLQLISEGIHIQQRYMLSWYDSLIVSAAQYSGCALLYSEDLQHGQQFGGVTVHDPFR